MKLAIMQPYFFPYIGYFQLIKAVDKFVLLDDVNYINKGWINRNYIYVNGKKNLFTIPLKKVSQNKLINEICLSDETNWREKILKSIWTSYKTAPEFEEAYGLIEKVFNYECELLKDYLLNSFKEIIYYLGIKTELVKSSAIYNNKHYKGQERILDICQKEKTHIYINAINGMELYSKDDFAKKGIEIKFIKMLPLNYRPGQAEIGSYLSFIDVLMHCSKEKINELLQEYILE